MSPQCSAVDLLHIVVVANYGVLFSATGPLEIDKGTSVAAMRASQYNTLRDALPHSWLGLASVPWRPAAPNLFLVVNSLVYASHTRIHLIPDGGGEHLEIASGQWIGVGYIFAWKFPHGLLPLHGTPDDSVSTQSFSAS
ncbi:uncharacterized protein BT62DRAFT_1012956 [Guyanagaster necrorhizus]|uniref:Uncharacterized protein n=1 Tax=Guyanagaster necrorhizus TaxID=856835 RepID=A0A9P7VGL1_9AGAR|nr:uncharacterized protein BT62DRAFT_1012956 [Guyanagaster necrorhizus MCA 3950]KAG7440187.1 hypothetical protein BT62DRAFT_1012956 [Guyanagaster necrorhizus MCA 3950]